MPPDDRPCPTERGVGTVSSTGEVSLTGEAGDLTGGYEATYRGQIDGKLFASRVQVWQLPDKTNYKRSCTIVVSRLRIGEKSPRCPCG